MIHAAHIQADEFHTSCEKCRYELQRYINKGGRDGATDIIFQIAGRMKP